MGKYPLGSCQQESSDPEGRAPKPPPPCAHRALGFYFSLFRDTLVFTFAPDGTSGAGSPGLCSVADTHEGVGRGPTPPGASGRMSGPRALPGDLSGTTSPRSRHGTGFLPLITHRTFCHKRTETGTGRKKLILVSSPQLRAVSCPQPYFPISPLARFNMYGYVDRMWSVRACRSREQT